MLHCVLVFVQLYTSIQTGDLLQQVVKAVIFVNVLPINSYYMLIMYHFIRICEPFHKDRFHKGDPSLTRFHW